MGGGPVILFLINSTYGSKIVLCHIGRLWHTSGVPLVCNQFTKRDRVYYDRRRASNRSSLAFTLTLTLALALSLAPTTR